MTRQTLTRPAVTHHAKCAGFLQHMNIIIEGMDKVNASAE
jgi:hypothetical protein